MGKGESGKGPRRIGARTALKLVAAVAIFVAGLVVGGGLADSGAGTCGAPVSVGGAR